MLSCALYVMLDFVCYFGALIGVDLGTLYMTLCFVCEVGLIVCDIRLCM